MTKTKLRMTKLPHAEDLPAPAEQATGLDLVAAILEPIVIEPGQRAAIPTGLGVALPPGFGGADLAALRACLATRGHRAQWHCGGRLSRRGASHPDQSRHGAVHRRAGHAHRAISRRAGAGSGLRMVVAHRMAASTQPRAGEEAMTRSATWRPASACKLPGNCSASIAASIDGPCRPRRWSTACTKARACTFTTTGDAARSGACQSWLPKCPTQLHGWLSNATTS